MYLCCRKIVENHGYEYLSLSDVLREEYKKENPNKRKIARKDLQDFGDKVRETKGADYLAQIVCKKSSKIQQKLCC